MTGSVSVFDLSGIRSGMSGSVSSSVSDGHGVNLVGPVSECWVSSVRVAVRELVPVAALLWWFVDNSF